MKKLTSSKPKPKADCCTAAKLEKKVSRPEKSAQCCAKASRLVAGCHD